MPLTVEIPGRETLVLDHLLLDQNGTLTDRGELIDGVAERLALVKADLHPHLLSADTFGTLEQLSRELDIKAHRVRTGAEKQRFLARLVPPDALRSATAPTTSGCCARPLSASSCSGLKERAQRP